MEEIVVSGASIMKNMAQFDLQGLPNIPGVVARIFQHLSENHVVVDDIIQTADAKGKASCSFTIEQADQATSQLAIEQLHKEYNFDSVNCKQPVAKISVVGVGMRSHTGVAQTMFKALGDAEINIDAITTSEIKISCLIDPEDAQLALQVVHDAFNLDKEPN